MREVRRSVERVNVPAILGRAFLSASFFRHYAVGGELCAQTLDYEALRGAIGLGYEVELAFQLPSRPAMRVLTQECSGFTANFDSCLDERSQAIRSPRGISRRVCR